MPYKDKQKYREAYKRWAKKNREKLRVRNRIKMQSIYHNPIPQVCSIKGCKEIGERHHEDYSKPKEIIWLCRKHHKPLYHRNERKCGLDECDKKHIARGLCGMHLKRFYRGKPIIKEKP